MGRDTFHETKLYNAPSNLVLNTARDEASTENKGKKMMTRRKAKEKKKKSTSY